MIYGYPWVIGYSGDLRWVNESTSDLLEIDCEGVRSSLGMANAVLFFAIGNPLLLHDAICLSLFRLVFAFEFLLGIEMVSGLCRPNSFCVHWAILIYGVVTASY